MKWGWCPRRCCSVSPGDYPVAPFLTHAPLRLGGLGATTLGVRGWVCALRKSGLRPPWISIFEDASVRWANSSYGCVRSAAPCSPQPVQPAGPADSAVAPASLSARKTTTWRVHFEVRTKRKACHPVRWRSQRPRSVAAGHLIRHSLRRGSAGGPSRRPGSGYSRAAVDSPGARTPVQLFCSVQMTTPASAC
jgi:hypothetical protein